MIIYADDTFLTLEINQQTIQKVVNTFKNFKNISGIKINIDKTEAIQLGPMPHNGLCPVLDIPYKDKFKI